jgi:hypothetical protein
MKAKKSVGQGYGSAPKSNNESNIFGGMIPVAPFVTTPHQETTRFKKSTPVTAKRQTLPALKQKKTI